METFKVQPKEKISASLTVPGDKSITHRAVIFSALSEGQSYVYGYLDAEDCNSTIRAFKSSGINIKKERDRLIIDGKGIDGLRQPPDRINAGNSGTTIRLLCGVFAGQDVEVEMYGDESLSKRPMNRVIEPLRRMNVQISGVSDQYAPLKIRGNPGLKPIIYDMPVSSAQVKSCILLAGMQAKGTTIISEPMPSRDHTERMLKYMDAGIHSVKNEILIDGPVKLQPKDWHIPGDISSAAFFIAAGLLGEASEVEVKNVGINPMRTGLIEVLKNMGADIKFKNERLVCNEPVGDIVARSSNLKGIRLDSESVPKLIDEIPLLALLSTQAQGKTVIKGAGELRFKESDRIKAITAGLKNMGANITETIDGFVVEGKTRLKGAAVDSYNDHRIAMAVAIGGLFADGETTINNSECVNISFPEFWKILGTL